MLTALILALASSVAYGVGAVFQGVGAQTTNEETEGAKGLLNILKHPFSLAGLVLDLAAWIMSRFSLHRLPLFAVQTMLAGSLALTVGLSHRLLHTPKRRADTFAIAITGIGLTLVGFAAADSQAESPSVRFEVLLFAALPILMLMGVLAIQKRAAPPVLGLLAGLSFGFSALSARAIVDVDGFIDLLKHRLLFVMLVYAALGVVLFTRGVERGQVGSVTAAMWAAEIVPPSIIGFVMLGDTVRSGWAPAAAIGIVLTLAATASLARPIEVAPVELTTAAQRS